MEDVQKLMEKMAEDYKGLLAKSEGEMNKNLELLEKDGKVSHVKFIKDTIADAKAGKSFDVSQIIETFNNLK